MTTKIYEKVKKEIKQELMDEFILPILRGVKDTEGEYREEFIKRVLKAVKERPKYTYNPKTFLQQLAGK